MSHTPAPWFYDTEGRRAFLLDIDGATIGELVTPGMNDATRDVEHIVRCVNAHDDILAALERLVYWYARRHGDDDLLMPTIAQEPEIQNAIKAIAKAKGTEL